MRTAQPTTAMTQNEAIANLLFDRQGEWVPMPKLAKAARAYAVHSRIADLRRLGFNISNRVRTVRGRKLSEYRLNHPKS